MKTDTPPKVEEPRTRGSVRGSVADGGPARGGGEGAGSRFRIPVLLGAMVVLSLVLLKASLGNEIPLLVARSQAISERTLEQEFGLRVDLVGMSAGGGLIDFRFTVLEPDKAAPLFDPPTTGSSARTQEHAKATLPGSVRRRLEHAHPGAGRHGPPSAQPRRREDLFHPLSQPRREDPSRDFTVDRAGQRAR